MSSLLAVEANEIEAAERTSSGPLPTRAAGARHPGAAYFVPILGAAAVVRLLVVWSALRSHPPAWFFHQATELAALAHSLATGHGLGSPFGGNTGPSAFLAPGYPAIVAAVFAVFGLESRASEAVVMLLQAAFGVGAVFSLMLLTRRLFNARAANIAGTLLALSPPAIFLPIMFWETSLTILLLTSSLVLVLEIIDHPTVLHWIDLGVFDAFAIAVNPSLLLTLLACGAWAAWAQRRSRATTPLLALAGLLLLALPWTIRNEYALHAFIPLRSNMGYELWQGNRAGSDGFFHADLHPNTSTAEFQRFERLGEVAYMSEKSTIARRDITADPWRFLQLSLKRVVFFWSGVGREPSPIIVACLLCTLAGGAWGLALLLRRARNSALLLLAPLLLFPLPYYLTHPDFRFRLVIDPILIALTAYAVEVRSRRGL